MSTLTIAWGLQQLSSCGVTVSHAFDGVDHHLLHAYTSTDKFLACMHLFPYDPGILCSADVHRCAQTMPDSTFSRAWLQLADPSSVLCITGVSQSAGHKGFAATPLDRDSPEKGVTARQQQNSSLLAGSTGGLGKDSAVKESTSAGQGTGVISKDSPKAVPGGCCAHLCNMHMSTDVVAELLYFVQSLLCKALMLASHLQNLIAHTLHSECVPFWANWIIQWRSLNPCQPFTSSLCTQCANAHSCSVSDNAYHHLPVLLRSFTYMPCWCGPTPTSERPDSLLGNVLVT